MNLRRIWMLVAPASAGFVLPALRLLAVIDWPWAVVLAPFTAVGVVFAGVIGVFFYREQFALLRTGAAGTTPPPDHLDPPPGADAGDDRILAQHPEILAALCHGFRMKRLLPTVLGQPVTDPWGVYTAALTASAGELESLRLLATLHTARFAQSGRKGGRRPSDADAMRAAIDAFHRCASNAEAGRGHPDCPFEHVTVIFGTRSPNRDANLRSVAPKVRALLERRYPQLTTARLADGSSVKFADWRKTASEDRAELVRLRKEHERQDRTVIELRAQVVDERARVDVLRDAADAQRRQAHEARAEQEQVVAELRAAVERAARDHTRDRQRHEAAMSKLSAVVDSLTHERDSLELALLASAGSADEADPASDVDLSGVRVLLVGGEARQVPPIGERLESLGAHLLHDDGVAAGEHIGHVQLVVFWIRYLSHPTYFGVRQRARAARAPHCYWMRTSPDSLVALVARALAEERAPAAEPAIAARAASTG